jgi:hypothetical protein
MKKNPPGVNRRAPLHLFGIAVAIGQMLGIAGTQFETGAAGTTYFEPGGVSFRVCPESSCWIAEFSEHEAN